MRQRLAQVFGNVFKTSILAELHCPDVCHDRPAIARVDPAGIAGHGSETIADDVIKMAIGTLTQTLNVIGRRSPESAANNHSIAISRSTVANGTINIESLPASFQESLAQAGRFQLVKRLVKSVWMKVIHRPISGVRNLTDELLAVSTCIERNVLAKMSTSNRPFNRRPRGKTIPEELAGLKRLIARLIVHVESIASGEYRENQYRQSNATIRNPR